MSVDALIEADDNGEHIFLADAMSALRTLAADRAALALAITGGDDAPGCPNCGSTSRPIVASERQPDDSFTPGKRRRCVECQAVYESLDTQTLVLLAREADRHHRSEVAALEAENARLREALKRLMQEAVLDGMETRAGWDCRIANARAVLGDPDA